MAKKKSVSESVSPSVVSIVPEVVSGPLTDQVPEIRFVVAVDRLFEITKGIRDVCADVAESFVSIGDDLRKVRDDPSLLKDCGYSDVYDYASKELGFGRTSTKNFIEVAAKFSKDGCLLKKYRDYSFTKLVELVPVDDDIDSYSPEMTVSEIRNKKALERAKDDKAAFMLYFKRSMAGSLSKAGFSGVDVQDLLPDGEGSAYSGGPFQVRVAFLSGKSGFTCTCYFKAGKFFFQGLCCGQTYVAWGGGGESYASCADLVGKFSDECSSYLKKKAKSASRSSDSGSSSGSASEEKPEDPLDALSGSDQEVCQWLHQDVVSQKKSFDLAAFKERFLAAQEGNGWDYDDPFHSFFFDWGEILEIDEPGVYRISGEWDSIGLFVLASFAPSIVDGKESVAVAPMDIRFFTMDHCLLRQFDAFDDDGILEFIRKAAEGHLIDRHIDLKDVFPDAAEGKGA